MGVSHLWEKDSLAASSQSTIGKSMKDASRAPASSIFTPDTTKTPLYCWGAGREGGQLSSEPMAHRTNGRIVNCSSSDHNLNCLSIRLPLGQIQRAPVQVPGSVKAGSCNQLRGRATSAQVWQKPFVEAPCMPGWSFPFCCAEMCKPTKRASRRIARKDFQRGTTAFLLGGAGGTSAKPIPPRRSDGT